jgi:hypothetical protein
MELPIVVMVTNFVNVLTEKQTDYILSNGEFYGM